MSFQFGKLTWRERALLIGIFKQAKPASSITDEEIVNIRRDKLGTRVYDSINVIGKKIQNKTSLHSMSKNKTKYVLKKKGSGNKEYEKEKFEGQAVS